MPVHLSLAARLIVPAAFLALFSANPSFAGPMDSDVHALTPDQLDLASPPGPKIEVTGPLSPAEQTALEAVVAGRYDEAIKLANEAAASAGSGASAAPAYEVLGIAQYLKGDTPAAMASLQRAVQSNPKQGSALTRLGSIALADNDLPTAKTWFEQALQVAPKDRLARRRLAEVLERQGDVAGAVAEYQQLVASLPPDQLGARVDLARLYNRQHRYTEAVQLLAPAANSGTRDIAALIALGTAEVGAGQVDNGLNVLSHAHLLAPTDANAALALGIAQRIAGQLDASVASLQQVIAEQPSQAAAYYQIGLSYLGLSKYPEAQQALERAKSIDPKATAVDQGLGESLLLGGKPADAIAIFGGLAARDNASLSDFVSLATAYQLSGNLPAAEKTYRDAATRFPRDPAAYWRLGAMLALERRYPDALDVLGKARQLAPDDPRVLRDISLVQFREGHAAEAIATARRLVALDPKGADARFYLAGLYQDSGDLPRAIETYRAILADHPDDAYALNNLAAVLTDRGDLGEAVPLARHAASLMPNVAPFADTLGWALLKAGNPAEAVASLDHARKLAPRNPETLYRLAAAQDAAGDAAAAQGNAEKALAISADFKDAAAAKALAGKRGG